MSPEATSFIGDLRKLLEEMVAPSLATLKGDVEYLRKDLTEFKVEVNRRFAEVEMRFDKRFDKLEERLEVRFNRLEPALDTYKQVQDLREWKIRTEAREEAQRAS